MEKQPIVAFISNTGEADCNMWNPAHDLTAVLAYQDTHGRGSVVWAANMAEGIEALAAKFPSKSGWPRVLNRREYGGEQLLVLAEEWALVPPAISEDVILDLLAARNRVGVNLIGNEVVSYERLDSKDIKVAGYRSTWQELYIERKAGEKRSHGGADVGELVDPVRGFFSKLFEKIEGTLPNLSVLSYARHDYYDCKTHTLVNKIHDILEDWHTVFGAKNTAYRRLDEWRRLVVVAGNQAMLRRVNQYCRPELALPLLLEVVAAQHRRVKGVTPTKQWPIAQLLAEGLPFDKLVYWKPSKRRKKPDERAA